MKKTSLFMLLIAGFFCFVAVASADEVLPELVVPGEAIVKEQDKITIKPEGLPAKVEVLTRKDIERVPTTGHYIDVLRGIPGVKIDTFPRGVTGHLVSMRGFYNQNATAVFIDGMPMNTLFWPEGQSQLDWLAPELIERIEVIKGPFSALYGNFALGGVVNITTRKGEADSPSSVGVSGGSYGAWRGSGVLSEPIGKVKTFLMVEGYTREGYRDNDEYRRGQAFGKLTVPIWDGDLSLRAHYSSIHGGFPGFLRVDQLKNGTLKRTDATNPTDKSESEVADVVLNYTPRGGEEGLHATFFASDVDQTVVGTLGTSPQIRVNAKFNYYGWKVFYDYRPLEQLSVVAGMDLRYDDVSTGYGNTNPKRMIISYDYTQLNTGYFTQVQYKPFSFAKITGGLRYDKFNTDVTNKTNSNNSGDGSSDIFSPKIGLVITPFKDINFFANKGFGFSSPGVTAMSPFAAARKANLDLEPAELDTWDVGVNALFFKRLFASFTYYNTLYQREAAYNSKTGLFDNLGESERNGFEVEAKFHVTENWNLYGSWAHVHARLKNPSTPGADRIGNVPEDVTTLGLQFQMPIVGGDQQVEFDTCWVRYGGTPANTTGTLMGPEFNQVRTRLAYRYKKWTFSLDAAYTPDKYAASLYSIQDNQLAINPMPEFDLLFGVKYEF